MSKFSIRKIAASAALAVAALSPVASHAAAQLNNYLVTGVNLLEDTDFDRVLRCTNTAGCRSLADYSSVNTGDFQVGDILEAALRFENASGTQLGNLNNYQLTAYSAIAVAQINTVTVPLDPIHLPGTNVTVKQLIFAPTGILGAGGMVRLYESAVENFNVTLTPAQMIANITGGTELMTLGYGVGEDDYWFASVGLGLSGGALQGNIDQLTTLSSSSAILGTGQLGLSVLSNPGLIPVVEEAMDGALGGKHDVVGQVAAYKLGPTANTGWLVETDTKVRFTVIPEPSGVALLGLAVVAAGYVGSRRRKA